MKDNFKLHFWLETQPVLSVSALQDTCAWQTAVNFQSVLDLACQDCLRHSMSGPPQTLPYCAEAAVRQWLNLRKETKRRKGLAKGLVSRLWIWICKSPKAKTWCFHRSHLPLRMPWMICLYTSHWGLNLYICHCMGAVMHFLGHSHAKYQWTWLPPFQ